MSRLKSALPQVTKLDHDLAQLKTPQVHRFPEYSVHYQDADAQHPLIGLWQHLARHNFVLPLAAASKTR